MITAKVPATSANLGAGFDTLGIAINVYNEFLLEKSDKLELIGCAPYDNEDNLLYTTLIYILEKGNYNLDHSFKITFTSNIAFGSGLGSSATCIVGGLLLGNELMNNKFTKDEMLKMAVDIEGHGDNVTPCIFGGLTSFMEENNQLVYSKLDVSDNYNIAILTSNQSKIGTEELRKSLPKEYSLADCSYNIAHAINTVLSLNNGNKDLLKLSTKDKLHEQYRGCHINDYDVIKEKALDLGAISLNISGAGPSLLLIYDDDFNKNKFIEFLNTLSHNWSLNDWGYTNNGASILKGGQ